MKIKKIQIFRHLTQIISLFLLPGLYILAFDQLKAIYKMIIGGNLNFINIFPSLIELTTVIFATIIIGRFFCGWFCTFGAYNDLIYYINKKVFKVKFKIDPKIDAILKYTKYLVLVLIIVISWTIGSTILKSTSPWDAFAQITDISTVLSTFAIGLILLILISIGAFFIERFFCRYLCPLGAIFTLISKISIFKINKPSVDCGKCRACTNNCSMSLPLYNVETVKGGECINCLKCVEVCPRKNAQANILGQDVNPVLASSVALSAFVGVYALNNLGSTILTNAGISSTTGISSNGSTSVASTKYKDGTYTGTGTGYHGGTTKISVTISNGQISDIKTISNEDTPRFYSSAESVMFNKIKSAGSTSVDTVSGATFTSNGIISAVKDALTQAESQATTGNSSSVTSSSDNSTNNTSKTDTSTQTTSNVATDNSNTTNSNVTSSTSSQSQYKDGTYTGTGTGYKRGTTKLSVTIKSGVISSIETISSQDTPRFYDNTKDKMFSKIISANSTSVDTVSGATFTSKGIISAVQSALDQAK